MPVFAYLSVDSLGRSHRGEMDANSESALEGLLKQQGQWLAEAAEVRGEVSGAGNRKVPSRVLIDFFLQLSIQLKEGIPILAALSFGVKEGTHPGFRAVQRDMLERVRAGSPLSDAMRAHPRTFEPIVINLVRAGESSGKLSELCREIHRHYEWVDRLKADATQALIYPSVVLGTTFGMMIIVFTFVVPKFALLLQGLNVPLPFLTRTVLALSHFLVHEGWMAAVGACGLVAGLQWARRRWSAVAEFVDRIKLTLPIFGPLAWMISQSRFAQNLSTLLRSGIPVLEALALTRSLVGNVVVEKAIARIEKGVTAGRQIHETMALEPVFSRLVLQMVQVGETTGSLGESLQNVADFYGEVLPRQIKKFFAILEPLIIVALLVLVGGIAGAIFLPIISLLGGGGS